MIAREVYLEGLDKFRGYSNTRFQELVKCENPVRYIYEAGLYWPNFDFEKGQEALLNCDRAENFIYLAGLNWEQFNYEEGLNKLIEIDKEGNTLFRAKNSWPLTVEQIEQIEGEYNIGYWTYIEFINGKITEEEALEKGLNIKWERKVNKLSGIEEIKKEKKEKKEKKKKK